VDSEVDTLLLRDVADATGGLFFRATDANAVRDAFAQIDGSEKIEFGVPPPLVSRELFPLFALVGVSLLGLASLHSTIRKRIDA
jgi:Ca-activated chloride channel family protein